MFGQAVRLTTLLAQQSGDESSFDWATSVAVPAAGAVVAALVAAVSAVIKTWFVQRDDRTRASNQLKLAAARTEFAATWFEAMQAVEDDAVKLAQIKARVRDELEDAYAEAQSGAADGKSVLDSRTGDLIREQLRSFLLLKPGLGFFSKLVVAGFYCLVFGFLLAASPTRSPFDEYTYWPLGSAWTTLAVMVLGGATLRYGFGRWVDYLEAQSPWTRQPKAPATKALLCGLVSLPSFGVGVFLSSWIGAFDSAVGTVVAVFVTVSVPLVFSMMAFAYSLNARARAKREGRRWEWRAIAGPLLGLLWAAFYVYFAAQVALGWI